MEAKQVVLVKLIGLVIWVQDEIESVEVLVELSKLQQALAVV